MRTACWFTSFALLTIACCQAQIKSKPCIAFDGGGPETIDSMAREPLSTAVTLSGDFEFSSSSRTGCWTVNVLSLVVRSGSGVQVGYAVSYTVTDPSGFEVNHYLMCGQEDIFDGAMRKAAADAVKNIRFVQSLGSLQPPSTSITPTPTKTKSKSQ